jgi:hypothetical protein
MVIPLGDREVPSPNGRGLKRITHPNPSTFAPQTPRNLHNTPSSRGEAASSKYGIL